jgi:hypothetical protein
MAEIMATTTIHSIPLLTHDEATKAISSGGSSALYGKGKTGGKKHYTHCNKDNYSSEDCNSQKTCKKYKVKGHIKRFCPDKKKKEKDNDNNHFGL